MESWLIYSLSTALLLGLFSFTSKVVSEKKLDENLSLFFLYLFLTIICFFGVILFSKFEINLIILSVSVIMGIGYPIVLKTRLISLRYLDTSTYFINYRIFSSTILIFSGMFIFSEMITFYQIIGILIGFLTFYLLLNKKNRNETNKEFRTGITYLFYGILLVSFLHIAVKYNSLNNPNVIMYLFLMSLISTVVIIISDFKNIKQFNYKLKKSKELIRITFIQATLFFGNSLTFYYAYKFGNLAIVYKVVSYSLFVPIVLSIMFYKEKVTVRKFMAFVLTIVSVWLFTI